MASFDIAGLTGITGGSSASRSPILALREKLEKLKTASVLSDSDMAARIRLRNERTTAKSQGSALDSIRNELSTLRGLAQRLRGVRDGGPFARVSEFAVKSGDTQFATATGTKGVTPAGTFEVSISQLATTTSVQGGAFTAATSIKGAQLGGDITTGTKLSALGVGVTGDAKFKINDQEISISADATIQDALNAINANSNTGVTATFANNQITLQSLTGSSNFALKDTSGTFLGSVGLAAQRSLAGATLSSTLTASSKLSDLGVGGGSDGSVKFKINGTEISVNNTDTIQTVLNTINDSAAGVVAKFGNNQISLTELSGDSSFTLQDLSDTSGSFFGSAGLLSQTSITGSTLGSTVTGTSKLSDLGLDGIDDDSDAISFKINGTEITADGGDTIQEVLDKINSNSATGVTATLVDNKIKLSSTTGASSFALEDVESSFLDFAGLGQTTTVTGSVLGSGITTSSTLDDIGVGANGNAAVKFKINGVEIFVKNDDTLASVLSEINNSDAGVTATFADNRISLTSKSGSISLDDKTKQFLENTGLLNGTITTTSNGTISTRDGGTSSIGEDGTVAVGVLTAQTQLGSVTGLTTNNGALSIKVNGKTINFQSTNTIQDVVSSINSSGAGVTATFDAASGKFSLTNELTGSADITLEDVSGNLLTASKLSTGATKTAGQDATFTVSQLIEDEEKKITKKVLVENGISSDNIFSAAETKIAGLTVNALSTTSSSAAGAVTITVTEENTKANIEKAADSIKEFVDQFNTVQDTLAKFTGEGGILQFDRSVSGVSQKLRAAMGGILGSSGSSNGQSNKITLDTAGLKSGLGANFDAIEAMIRNQGGGAGIADRIEAAAASLVDQGGAVTSRIVSINKEVAGIDRELDTLAKREEDNRDKLEKSLQSMASSLVSMQRQTSFVSNIGSKPISSSNISVSKLGNDLIAGLKKQGFN
jgi:hypothetical protein